MRAILTWHSIDPSGSVISVAPDTFRAQLEAIRQIGLRVVGIPELLALPDDAEGTRKESCCSQPDRAVRAVAVHYRR